ncbi:MAG TPA: hypothetical protein VHK01_22285 [Lacipirellulaceae bacterium]|jgi:hypothetical protein|nr:hypothetical protein [Lacipirellulaceae bacterium]
MKNDRAHSAWCVLFDSNRSCFASFIILAVCSSSVVAQIDTDPTNDEQVNGDDLGLLPGFAVSNRATLAAPDNDVDFFTVQLSEDDVVFGMTTPITSLPSTFETPNTMASVVSFGSQATFSNDDLANELPSAGDTLGSLFRFQAPFPSTYYVGITGFGDLELDGAASGSTHAETGDYIFTAGVVTPSVPGGGFTDTDPANDTRLGADAIPGGPGAHVAVLDMLAEDVDFFRLTLTAGQILSAMTAPLDDLPISFSFPDTVIGLFDSAGTPLVVNDDAGDEGASGLDPTLGSDIPTFPEEIFGSAIRALIPSDGVYYLGVTGFEDDNFIGDHGEFGIYALLVGVASLDSTEPLPGDFNADGTVDAADYVVWRKNVGGQFDEADYLAWRTNFGRSNGTGANALAAVPEPSAFIALLVSVIVITLLSRKATA